MSYPYGRPGGSGSGDPRGVGVPGGQRGVGVPGGQWVPVAGSGGSGSGGRGSSAGVIVGCLVGLVVAALVGGVAFVALRSGGSEPGSNPTASPTATARPTEQQTIASDHYWADVLGGKFHIESTSVVQGPTDQDGAATLLVTLTMTNNTNESEYIMNHVPFLEQNGVDLDFAKLDPDQYPDVVVEMSDDLIEPGDTKTLVVGFKYIYVGEPVVFQTDIPVSDNIYDFPKIVVQPS